MYTIALVGLDGSGKTTVARHLEKFSPSPCKYLYMGQSIHTNNVILPTTRLARYLKLHVISKDDEKLGNAHTEKPNSGDLHYGYGGRKRGPVRVSVGLLNRIVEAWWRQLLSLNYQLQGYIVVYDRHFLIEAAVEAAISRGKKNNIIHQLEYRIFRLFYPKPKLIIFLDTPEQVLYERKSEATLKSQATRRAAILEVGGRMLNFVIVDANRPLERVIADVMRIIAEFPVSRKLANGNTSKSKSEDKNSA